MTKKAVLTSLGALASVLSILFTFAGQALATDLGPTIGWSPDGVGPSGNYASYPMNYSYSIYSPSGVYHVEMQSDGNLVLRHSTAAIWSSGTSGHTSSTFNLQEDGNLVVRSSTGAALWNAGTGGGGAYACYQLTVQNDGNFVLRKGTISTNFDTCLSPVAIWATNTVGQ